jgi:hypothetical protein
MGMESSGQTRHIESMTIPIISVKLVAELGRLYTELANAHARAAHALHMDPPGHIQEGEALARILAGEEKIAAIVRRIKEIQGEK